MPVPSTQAVLVVEDEDEVRTLFSMLLEGEEFTVFQARDGKEGLDLLEAHLDDIALVITDLNLPILGGVDLIQRVRSLKPTVRVIATSGLGGERVREMVLGAGADEFYQKPFESRVVIQRVKELIRPM